MALIFLIIQETAGVEKIPFWPITNSPTLKTKSTTSIFFNIINDSKTIDSDWLNEHFVSHRCRSILVSIILWKSDFSERQVHKPRTTFTHFWAFEIPWLSLTFSMIFLSFSWPMLSSSLVKYCQNNLLFMVFSHIMTMYASVYFFTGIKTGLISALSVVFSTFDFFFSPVHS